MQSSTRWGPPCTVSTMVTKIHSSAKKRLFLRENRKAKGVRPDVMAGRLGIERESLHRLEREWWRLKGDGQAAYADALGIEPEALWRLPSDLPSLDAMIKSAPRDVQEMATDIVRRLASGIKN